MIASAKINHVIIYPYISYIDMQLNLFIQIQVVFCISVFFNFFLTLAFVHIPEYTSCQDSTAIIGEDVQVGFFVQYYLLKYDWFSFQVSMRVDNGISPYKSWTFS